MDEMNTADKPNEEAESTTGSEGKSQHLHAPRFISYWIWYIPPTGNGCKGLGYVFASCENEALVIAMFRWGGLVPDRFVAEQSPR